VTEPSSGLPITRDRVSAAASAVLGLEGADDVEVVVAASSTGLTRYALSEIIQNTVRNEIRAYVRVVTGSRVATASTTRLTPEGVIKAGERALDAARASRPDDEFPGLPDPAEVGVAEPIYRWSDNTAVRSPGARAAKVSEILRVADSDNAAGVFETSAHVYAVVSSKGIDCFDAYTRCVTTCLVDNGESTGWGEASSHDFDLVDVEAVARRAADKAERGRNAVSGEPGTYEVVLEPPAVGVMVDYLSYAGMSAKQVIEGESFLATRGSEQVGTESITVADDAFHPCSVGLGFDLEGVPKKRVAVIDRGVAKQPVTDLRTARQLDLAVSGHYSGSTEYGPYAANPVLEEGTSSREEMIAAISDGYLVTRFHYVNILDRPATLLTGMTRDGTFRIRDGEIAEPVHNFRFAQSVLDAFATTKAVGSELVAFAPDYGSFGSAVVPALHVGAFSFASTTSH
jgi:predicted Zn-dependent protease